MNPHGDPNFDAKKAWILVVEDDKALNKALCDQLGLLGYRTVAAHKVAEALGKLTKQTFDCVLLDLRFDARSGEQVVEFMRGSDQKNNRETPILIMSGFLDPMLIKRLGQHVNGILVKPFDQKVLVEKVGAAISSPSRRLAAK